MIKKIKRHHISFKNAFAGIGWAFRTQPNFTAHIIISCFLIAIAFYLGVSFLEAAILIFAIVFGLGSEMINTALEAMTDLITQEWRKEAKVAKDVAAGMMLLIAMGTALIGFLILGPKIYYRIFGV